MTSDWLFKDNFVRHFQDSCPVGLYTLLTESSHHVVTAVCLKGYISTSRRATKFWLSPFYPPINSLSHMSNSLWLVEKPCRKTQTTKTVPFSILCTINDTEKLITIWNVTSSFLCGWLELSGEVGYWLFFSWKLTRILHFSVFWSQNSSLVLRVHSSFLLCHSNLVIWCEKTSFLRRSCSIIHVFLGHHVYGHNPL